MPVYKAPVEDTLFVLNDVLDRQSAAPNSVGKQSRRLR